MMFEPTKDEIASLPLNGLSYEKASCYGMPHIGSYYAGSDVHSNRLDGFALCACCGAQATNSHHEPQLGMGGGGRSFLLETKMGKFVLKPALIALCGMGNASGCHGKRHKGQLSFRWAWNDRESFDAWWSGDLLAHGMVPHDPVLYEHGRWELFLGGKLLRTVER